MNEIVLIIVIIYLIIAIIASSWFIHTFGSSIYGVGLSIVFLFIAISITSLGCCDQSNCCYELLLMFPLLAALLMAFFIMGHMNFDIKHLPKRQYKHISRNLYYLK